MAEEQTYDERVAQKTQDVGSNACMGIDPVWDALPGIERNHAGFALKNFLEGAFYEINRRGLAPAAFKLNEGFYTSIDRPRSGAFVGTQALWNTIALARHNFPQSLVILDNKRGDIAKSSRNYGEEAYNGWEADACTVSPYMGDDSVLPFTDVSENGRNGTYVLTRTSNPGARVFQDLEVTRGGVNMPLYLAVANEVANWHDEHAGIGSVVGATFPEELSVIAGLYARSGVPLLIPGVGSQGALGADVNARLLASGYDRRLALINSSSGVLQPWAKKKQAPPQHPGVAVADNLEGLMSDCRI